MATKKVSRKHALNVGKSLRAHFPEAPLSALQEWAARLLGYRDLHEMASAETNGTLRPLISDEALTPDQLAKRKVQQARSLAKDAGVSLEQAHQVLEDVAPTAGARPRKNGALGKFLTDLTGEAFLEPLSPFLDRDSAMGADAGLAAAIEAMKSGQNPGVIGKISIEAIIMRARAQEHSQNLMIELLELGAQAGWVELAYELAGCLTQQWEHSASSDTDSEPPAPPRAQVLRVDRLYQMVIENADETSNDLKSAAIVNRTAFVRDGWISGGPDWQAAVKAYVQAAEMGNVVGAFNAGNVADWLRRQGRDEFIPISIKWLGKAIDMIDRDDFELQHISSVGARQLRTTAVELISHLVLQGKVDPDHAPIVASAVTEYTAQNLRAKVDLATIAFERNVRSAQPHPQSSILENWKLVLKFCGWEFASSHPALRVKDPRSGRHVTCEIVDCSRQIDVKLIAINDACLPEDNGEALILAALKEARKAHRESHLLCLGRKALVREVNTLIYTGVWTMLSGASHPVLASIPFEGGSEAVIEQVQTSRGFGKSEADCSPFYLLAVAQNTLDEGVSAEVTADGGINWIGVGQEWRMPYYDVREWVYFGHADPLVVFGEGASA
ncbi:hypothetical protein [Variovorax gossypii]